MLDVHKRRAKEGGAEVDGLRRPSRTTHLSLLIPLLLFLAIFFAYPMIDILLRSLAGATEFPSLEHYARILNRPIYFRVFVNTFEIAFTVTLISLAIGYPLAYSMTVARPVIAELLMFCTVLPFFTSILVRTYGWMVILSPEGLLNQMLNAFRLASVQLIYNRSGVLIGMTYTLLPYMVLTLYSCFRGIDRTLLRAAANLGASRSQVFYHVFLPLSLPGIAGGALLVFILALGYFVTPALMGSGRDQMIAMIIFEQIDKSLNWEFAAALSTILLVCALSAFVLYNRLIGLRGLLEARR